ncbi:hypothetical protein MK805_01430 [Shimazuella sp. AN120528]|uniref:hypothetical protein n=1 Tax=Shimazuella soli TaxID=1892854 RepID=UPI001F1162FF|nr:hypothetical protein [Shimazuella soli]MCH5583633.1 hypothetical protein [Shimazuella soli]
MNQLQTVCHRVEPINDWLRSQGLDIRVSAPLSPPTEEHVTHGQETYELTNYTIFSAANRLFFTAEGWKNGLHKVTRVRRISASSEGRVSITEYIREVNESKLGKQIPITEPITKNFDEVGSEDIRFW